MGKYNSGTLEGREELAARLHAAMRKAAAAPALVCECPADTGMTLHREAIRFANRTDSGHTADDLEGVLETSSDPLTRCRTSLELSARRYRESGGTVTASSLAIGRIRTLHLPGEPMIAFQFFARQAAAENALCVAGYGNGNPFYYGPDSIFAERGGYEQTVAFAAPCQTEVERVITKLLRHTD